jgi:hypothetical protein
MQRFLQFALPVGGVASVPFGREEIGMRVIEIDLDDLDLDVIEFLEMSGKLRTREQLMRKFVLDVVDPVIALGDPFIFEQREDRDDYISPEVPGSDAQVDLAVAGRVAELDARACSIVLERDNSFDATFLVYKNTLGWVVFWSHRHPNERWRKRFAEQLEERKEGLEELKTKATYQFRLGLLEELRSIA